VGRIEPRAITLRDGTRCLLRCAEVGDATAILAYRRAQIGTHAFEINLPDEVDLDADKQREMIQESLDRANWVYILAVPSPPAHFPVSSPPRVLGGLLFRGQTKQRMQHHGTFGIAIDPAWRGRGIGRAMIEALLDWAAAHPSLVKVCLAVFADNAGAEALYRALGFVEEGRSLRHFQMEPRRFIDDVSMCIYVKPGVAPAGFNTWRKGTGHVARGTASRPEKSGIRGQGSGAGGQRRERRTRKSRA
jgi:RimJ/RimL family protein N-acetyltransferase